MKSSKNKAENAITLIVLVITIIIMLIIAGITLTQTLSNNGLLSKTKKAAIIVDFTKYSEEFELYKTEKIISNENFYIESLNAGKDSLTYNTQTEEEKKQGGNIKTIIKDLKEEYIDNFEVIKGELLYKSQDKAMLEIAKTSGIEINPYNIDEGGELKSSETNLMLMDSQGTLTLPETVTSIGAGAFSNTAGLKKVVIPYSCKEIKQNAFYNNTEIEEVIFETKENSDGTVEGCEGLGSAAFQGCTNIKEIKLPCSLNYLDGSVFYACTTLEKVNIPPKIKYLSWRNISFMYKTK